MTQCTTRKRPLLSVEQEPQSDREVKPRFIVAPWARPTARAIPTVASTRKPRGVTIIVHSTVLYQGSEPFGVS